MKLEHFLFLFVILMVVPFITMNSKIQNLQITDNKTVEYNRNIDQATDDAMNNMIEMVDDYDYTVNLDSCAESFFNSLYSSFGLLNNKSGQDKIKWYIPVLLVTNKDGFYVMYHSMNDEGTQSTMQWSGKMPYCYSGIVGGLKYTINFSMGDDIVLYYDGSVFKGDWHTIKSFYAGDGNAAEYGKLEAIMSALQNSSDPNAYMVSENAFNAFRLSVMQYQISKKMTYYVNQHNTIASAYGVNYKFSLPVSSTDQFARTIADISVLAIFQGYPIGNASGDTYSRFSVSGARLLKKSHYCLSIEDGIMYYHRKNCSHVTEGSTEYETKQECAAKGAYPCPYCHP